ncbi:head maturation protease, ClpP-related [Pseudooceanicola atlanticus]|uniref:head maturation protease, ClpP-related n=1 Tax=Pseudooceanicola atlanticus TaxID=1461694 RepID=UPI0023548B91|nr:head maturation protease, ClpP-related [Pseudooceanicola atlanticus]
MDGDDLILNGEIVLEGTVLSHDFCQWLEGGCFSAQMVRHALATFDGDVTIRVNSGGGDPYEGEAIRAAIEAHAGSVTVVVGGSAMSAASLMIMSADRIEMSAGSIFMIHDPSVGFFGTPDEHRQCADQGDVIADTYASVYAARAGMSATEARALMRVETFMGPEEAVRLGFADAVAGTSDEQSMDEAARQMAMSAHRGALADLRMCADKFNASGPVSAVSPTDTAGQTQASTAATQETRMDPEETQAGATPTSPAAGTSAVAATTTSVASSASTATMQAPDTAAIEERARREERDRQRGIREMARPFMASGQLTEAMIDTLIDEGTPLASAGNRLMAVMAASEPPITAGAGGAARITRDETDTQIEGLVCAMMRDYSGPGEQFRGMRLSGLAMHLASPGQHFDRTRTIERGFRSTSMMGGATGISDFAYITTEVMNRSLIAEYDRRGSGWNIVTGTPQEASDFRELHAVRFGGDFQLKTTKENGEYHEATLQDEAEGLKVERRGRTINLTFEAVINDDMGAFQRIPREFAYASRLMEASMVWSILRENAVLKSDKKALFHADHKNLAGSGGAISVATVGAARKAMWEQTAFGSKDKEDFLQVVADRLLVPPALETIALQFATGTTPAKDSDTNPYKNRLDPSVVPHLGAAAGGSDTAWYLVSSDLPPISVAYLDGYESPTVQTIEGMNPDKVTMNARHIFGAAPTEYRGSYKNVGA